MKIRDFQESDVGQVNRVAPATFDELKLTMTVALPMYLRMGFELVRATPLIRGLPYSVYLKKLLGVAHR
jgi:hypothetical protein